MSIKSLGLFRCDQGGPFDRRNPAPANAVFPYGNPRGGGMSERAARQPNEVRFVPLSSGFTAGAGVFLRSRQEVAGSFAGRRFPRRDAVVPPARFDKLRELRRNAEQTPAWKQTYRRCPSGCPSGKGSAHWLSRSARLDLRRHQGLLIAQTTAEYPSAEAPRPILRRAQFEGADTGGLRARIRRFLQSDGMNGESGTGVPPMDHGQDAHATSHAASGFLQ